MARLNHLLIAVFVVCFGGSHVWADEPGGESIAGKVLVQRGIEYARRGDVSLSLDWTTPPEPNGAAVLFIASDGWISHSYDPTPWMNDRSTAAGQLVADGFAFAVIRHRSGGDFKVPDAFADVREAVRFVCSEVDRFGIDRDRIGVFGKSAGGHLALLVGTVPNESDDESDHVRTVVAWSAPTDLRRLMAVSDPKLRQSFPALEFDSSLAESVSPLAHVSGDDASILMIHGSNDQLVPVVSSGLMHTMIQRFGGTSEFIRIEGAPHMFADKHYRQAVAETVKWFQTQLAE